MAKLEECEGCGVLFKHHELCRHRKTAKCGLEYPLDSTLIKASLKAEKQMRIAVKQKFYAVESRL